jgi:hypothetical protein
MILPMGTLWTTNVSIILFVASIAVRPCPAKMTEAQLANLEIRLS